ncbi:hypothetical protein PLESTM_001006900 [Pleodorina starrii]|nr:hypothetical protein PLESTM_001006900 [Pleodorina starrii]
MDEASCASLAYKKTSLALSVFPVAIVVRPCVGSNGSHLGYQTLVFSNNKDTLFGSNSRGSVIFELIGDGNDSTGQFRLAAQALELKERGPDGELRPYSCQVALHRAVYDSYTKAVYFVEGRALMRLGPDNVVSPLAGHRETCGANDGPGPSARFQLPHSLVSDGAGCLYVADCGAVRRVALPQPTAKAATAAKEKAVATAGPQGGSQGQEQEEQEQGQAVVTTMYGGPGSFVDVAYDILNRRLYAATISAVYHMPDDGRVPVRIAGWEAAPGGGAGAASATSGPAGGGGGGGVVHAATAAALGTRSYGGVAASAAGSSGGVDGFRRFSYISGLVADGDGGLLIADRHQMFRLEADGGPESVICLGKSDTSWGAVGCYPAILPNGWLALCQYHDRRLLLLQLGLRCSSGTGSGTGSGLAPYPRPPWQLHQEGVVGLLGDLASLLTCPDELGYDDVEVAVGGRRFRCHRLILSARCLYFRRLFAGGFADSGARQVVLQDADPDAFELLLRYMYTGDMAFPPHLMRAVAELADRLLLPKVVHHVHRRLLAAAQPAGVVADMLWAHQQGFQELLGGLKDWYLRHQAEVLAAAEDSVKQLFVAAPSLMYDLHCATVRQADRRR